jgi:hypothetical protein
MSKKSKRQVRKETLPTTSTTGSASVQTAKQPSFNPDYSYVKKDLRRIGILAGSFVLILVILSFFLH